MCVESSPTGIGKERCVWRVVPLDREREEEARVSHAIRAMR